MKLKPIIVTLTLLFSLLIFACQPGQNSVDQLTSVSPNNNQEEDPLYKSLEKSVEDFLDAIRKADTEKFLQLCSRNGIDIGVDNLVSYEEIGKDFDTQGSLFCHYFDTECLHDYLRKVHYKPPESVYIEGGTLPFPVSYREVLEKVTGLTVSMQIEKHPPPQGVFARVRVRWDSPPPRELGYIEFFYFVFILEDGKWKLSDDVFL